MTSGDVIAGAEGEGGDRRAGRRAGWGRSDGGDHRGVQWSRGGLKNRAVRGRGGGGD